MAKSNRQCYLCKVKYDYCPDCGRHDPTYMAKFCSTNCRDIFQTLSRYGVGLISSEECREYIDMLDLNKKDSYEESVINTINKVYATSKPVEDTVEIVVEEQPVEEVVNNTVEEQPAEEVVEEQLIEELVEEQTVEERVLEAPVEKQDIVVPNFERKSKKRNHEVVLEEVQ